MLLDLSEPYLLDLIGLIAKCLKLIEDDIADLARDGGYAIPETVFSRIDSLDYLEKAEVLVADANHIKAITQRDAER